MEAWVVFGLRCGLVVIVVWTAALIVELAVGDLIARFAPLMREGKRGLEAEEEEEMQYTDHTDGTDTTDL